MVVQTSAGPRPAMSKLKAEGSAVVIQKGSAMEYQIEITSGPDAFSVVQPQWEGMDQTTFCPMQSYIWFRACAESFKEGQPWLVCVRSSGEVKAYAALVLPPGESRLLCLGHALFEPTVFVWSDPESCTALANALFQVKKPVFLRDIYAHMPFGPAVSAHCAIGRICIQRPMPGHPWLKLDESWREPEQRLNSGRRSDLRRAHRNAEKLGALSFVNEAAGTQSLDALLEEIFEVERRNWKGRTGSAIAATPEIQGFYRRYCRMASDRGILRILRLRIGSHTVAMQLGVDYNNRFWLLKMGYDEAFARCSPGMLLMLESLRHAAQRGLEAYEMMGTREPWNRIWTDQSHACVSLRIYPPSLRGVFHAGVDVGRALIRKAAQARKKEKSDDQSS